MAGAITVTTTLPDSSNKADFYSLITSATLGGIVNDDVAADAAIVDTKLATISTASKVSGAALTSLTSVPAGAGKIPVANIDTGTTASKIVILDGNAKLPAVDGSALTGVVAKIVQVVNTLSVTKSTGITAITADDSIPQITEGDEYMTLAITPTSATNKLLIQVTANVSQSNNGQLCVALFQDATANALACAVNANTPNDLVRPICLTYYMVAGTTSATTFRVRAGGNTGATTTFNGAAGSRFYGGVLTSSITITEIAA
jgi:hypothetical protein